MVEGVFIFEENLFVIELAYVVTATTQAGGVFDLGLWAGPLGFGDVLDQLDHSRGLGPQIVLDAWGKMAVVAENALFPMLRFAPTLDIGLHVVAGCAEFRGLAVIENKPAGQSQHCQNEHCHQATEATGQEHPLARFPGITDTENSKKSLKQSELAFGLFLMLHVAAAILSNF